MNLPGIEKGPAFAMPIRRLIFMDDIIVSLHMPLKVEAEDVDIDDLIAWARAANDVKVSFMVGHTGVHPDDEIQLEAFLNILIQNKSLPVLDQ